MNGASMMHNIMIIFTLKFQVKNKIEKNKQMGPNEVPYGDDLWVPWGPKQGPNFYRTII